METIGHELKITARHLTSFGVLTLILGFAAIWAPFIAGLSALFLVGILVIAAGVMRMLWAFGMGTFGKGALMFALGGLTLLCGVSLFVFPLSALRLLTVLIAFYLFADGIAELVAAFRPHQAGRIWLLLAGVASIILGVVMWTQFLLVGVVAVGVLLGVKLIFMGSAMLASGSAARTLTKGGSPLSPAM